MKNLDYLQNDSEATSDDILLVIQQPEQTIHLFNKQSFSTENVSFSRNGSRQKKWLDWWKNKQYPHFFKSVRKMW